VPQVRNRGSKDEEHCRVPRQPPVVWCP
jgi:hypothetical protein